MRQPLVQVVYTVRTAIDQRPPPGRIGGICLGTLLRSAGAAVAGQSPHTDDQADQTTSPATTAPARRPGLAALPARPIFACSFAASILPRLTSRLGPVLAFLAELDRLNPRRQDSRTGRSTHGQPVAKE